MEPAIPNSISSEKERDPECECPFCANFTQIADFATLDVRGSAFHLMRKTLHEAPAVCVNMSFLMSVCQFCRKGALQYCKGSKVNPKVAEMWTSAKSIPRLSKLGHPIRNCSTFKSNLPDTAWVQKETYKWFMPMQTRFKVSWN